MEPYLLLPAGFMSLALAGAFHLAGCSETGAGAESNHSQDMSAMKSNSRAAPVDRSVQNGSARVEAVAPEGRRPRSASLALSQQDQFDLLCDLRGQMIADSNPARAGTPTLNRDPWRSTERYIIDLTTMRWCDPTSCRTMEPARIEFADSEEIRLYDGPRHRLSIRRRNGEYHQRLEDAGTVTVVSGRCRKVPFSSF